MACTLQAMMGGKFAPVIGLVDEEMDINTPVTDAASEILGKEHRRKNRGSSKMFSTSVKRGEI